MRIRLAFNGKSMTATLYDNPSARDLVSLLPLDLTIDNYGNNEKIAYLPRKLTEACRSQTTVFERSFNKMENHPLVTRTRSSTIVLTYPFLAGFWKRVCEIRTER